MVKVENRVHRNNRKILTIILKLIFLLIYYPLFVLTSLLFFVKVVKRGIPVIISLLKEEVFVENLMKYILFIFVPFLLLSGVFIFLIVRKIITKKHVLFLLLITTAVLIFQYTYSKFIYPKVEQKRIKISQSCLKNAEDLAKNKAESKGYKPNTDTYFVIYIATKNFYLDTCLYQNRLIREPPVRQHTFDWLPDVK